MGRKAAYQRSERKSYVSLSVYAETDLYAKIDKAAERDNCSISRWVINAITEKLGRHGLGEKKVKANAKKIRNR